MSSELNFNESLVTGCLKEFHLNDFFKGHSDIQFQSKDGVVCFYCKGMIDAVQFNEYYQTILAYLLNDLSDSEKSLPPLMPIFSCSDMVTKVFSGSVLFYKEGEKQLYGAELSNVPQRKPEESKVDISIKGPRDSFTEEANMNIALIRKRLKTAELFNESYTIGSLSGTNVSLLYLANKANPDTIREVQHRLNTIQTESVVSSGQLEQWLADRPFSLFPLFDYISRPDYAVECLLRGRFILVMDGSPLVLIGPANITLLLKSPEDPHFPYYFVLFQRILRLIGLLVAIFTPGFWVAVSNINMAQVPFSLIATIVLNRQGLPMPVSLETFLILVFFELLREASIRMPIFMGQTVSIVGGLIIGDAAIRAGLASPTLIVVVALTAVCTYTLVNQSLTGTVSILRLYILLLCTFLGIYGLFIGALSILAYLCQLESFHLSYTEPLTSLRYREYLSALAINPFKRKKFDAEFLKKGKSK